MGFDVAFSLMRREALAKATCRFYKILTSILKNLCVEFTFLMWRKVCKNGLKVSVLQVVHCNLPLL